MKLDLIYTIAVGNFTSYISIMSLQLTLYLLSIDMSFPAKGIIISILMSLLISLLAMSVIFYYNTSSKSKDRSERYVKTLDDKKSIFKKVIIISYVSSLIILSFLYMIDLGVANYSIYSAPLSVIILIVFIFIHDDSLDKKYNSLKTQTWVFDYNKIPTVRSIKNTKENSISIFDNDSKLIVSESDESMDIGNIFKEIPPGSKFIRSKLMKPSFQIIDFKDNFKYTSILIPKSLYLRYSNKEDEKIFSLYLDILSKYKGIYEIESKIVNCSHTIIEVNKEKIETYIENNEYIKKFVSSKDTKAANLSIKMENKIAEMSTSRFISKFGKKVETYEIKEKKDSLYIVDYTSKDDIIESNISYLKKYMTLNMDEYYQKKNIEFKKEISDNFHSIKEKIEARKRPEKNEVNENIKSLYKLNIKGELIYIFLEDIATMSEIDEIIITSFINRDILDILSRLKKTKKN